MRHTLTGLGFGFALLTASGFAQSAAFSDGSFETPVLSPGSLVFDPPTIGAWTVHSPSSTSVFHEAGAFGTVAQNGVQTVGFGGNGTVGGSISQTFDTVGGGNYAVQFYVSKQQDGAPGSAATFAVAVLNASTLASLYGATGSVNTTAWQLESFSFTATGSSSTLSFTDTGGANNPAYNQQVDNFTVTGQAPVTGVPEPASLLLFGAGLLGLVAQRRRR